jgi:hypothetical protein
MDDVEQWRRQVAMYARRLAEYQFSVRVDEFEREYANLRRVMLEYEAAKFRAQVSSGNVRSTTT